MSSMSHDLVMELKVQMKIHGIDDETLRSHRLTAAMAILCNAYIKGAFQRGIKFGTGEYVEGKDWKPS